MAELCGRLAGAYLLGHRIEGCLAQAAQVVVRVACNHAVQRRHFLARWRVRRGAPGERRRLLDGHILELGGAWARVETDDDVVPIWSQPRRLADGLVRSDEAAGASVLTVAVGAVESVIRD